MSMAALSNGKLVRIPAAKIALWNRKNPASISSRGSLTFWWTVPAKLFCSTNA
jgi:hypothetical protein